MDRKPLVPLAFIVLAGLLFTLGQIVPKPVFPLFEHIRLGGRYAPDPGGGPEVRAKAESPVPRRYVEACRSEAARRMARQDWAGLGREGQEAALAQVLILCGADAEYWAMSEVHQKRVAREFAEAFLDPVAAGSVDK